jgi:hypothetical protein
MQAKHANSPNTSDESSFLTKTEHFFRVFDRFGSSVTLFYNKESKFKTAFGGVMSIMSWICIAAYLGYLTDDVRNYKFSINSSTLFTDIIRDTTIYDVDTHFDVAFKAAYSGPDPTVLPNIDQYITFYA